MHNWLRTELFSNSTMSFEGIWVTIIRKKKKRIWKISVKWTNYIQSRDRTAEEYRAGIVSLEIKKKLLNWFLKAEESETKTWLESWFPSSTGLYWPVVPSSCCRWCMWAASLVKGFSGPEYHHIASSVQGLHPRLYPNVFSYTNIKLFNLKSFLEFLAHFPALAPFLWALLHQCIL